MPEQKLDLFQLTSGLMAKPGAGSTEIMRGDYPEAAISNRFADDGPDHFCGEPTTPDFAGLPNRAKQHSTLQTGRACPGIHGGFDPPWHRYGRM